MAIPENILQLVDQFSRNYDEYKSLDYSETSVRIEFIDHFFICLGWDVGNTEGLSEKYKTVDVGSSIDVEGAKKKPDYCFRIGGIPKFFVEAKKPSIDIKRDTDSSFQLRRYAWSAKFPISVLTNFEYFAIYDCRVKPKSNDSPSKARIKLIHYTEYPSQWDLHIYEKFSMYWLLRGAFDRYAEERRKTGTLEVDTAFLEEIEAWRKRLAENIVRNNGYINSRQLNFAIQKIIDRIIFLRMCEDKKIEKQETLKNVLREKEIYKNLLNQFAEAEGRYDSGLFHFHKRKIELEPIDDITPSLKISNNVLKEIIKSLYPPDSPYEFSVMPSNILGKVYEQFLGKVINIQSPRRVVIEDKPEVRQAGGVFYTPEYIVNYIISRTVGKLLSNIKTKHKTIASKIRILDPSCGSGSFLVGAYQYLLDWYTNYYVSDSPHLQDKCIYRGPKGDWRLTTREKTRILLSSVFGVDIDTQATEVAKLSLLLKALEGETDYTIERQPGWWGKTGVLPDLGGNIKCGNSLIGKDFYMNPQATLLSEDERYRINAFDWSSEFEGIIKAGGFDVVIGNPPYGAFLEKIEKNYLKLKYPNQAYQLDSYLLFLEKSVGELLKSGGFWGMIIPNPWLTNIRQDKTRKFITNNLSVVEIVHFRYKIFPKCTVDTQIVILKKPLIKNWQVLVRIVDSINEFTTDSNIVEICQNQEKWQKLQGQPINIFLSAAGIVLKEKCLYNSVPLSSFCKINVGIKPYQNNKGIPPQTEEIVKNRKYDSDKCIDESYRPYLIGSDIGRYKILPLESRFIKYGKCLAEPRPSANFDAPLKIFVRQTGDSLVAALDSEKYLCLNNMHVVVPSQDLVRLEFILGILNSRLMNWYYHSLNPEQGEALAEVKKTILASLPLINLNPDISRYRNLYDSIINSVQRLLLLNRGIKQVMTPNEQVRFQREIHNEDDQIDRCIYELYGLTEKEIIMVETDSQLEK